MNLLFFTSYCHFNYNIEIAKIQPITYTSYKLNIYFIK